MLTLYPCPRCLHACAALAVALIVPLASAQVFVGSDNFNDNTLTINGAGTAVAGDWKVSVVNGQTSQTGGAWTETNARMEYTLSADTSTTGMDLGQLVWTSPSTSVTSQGAAGLNAATPYASTWTARIDVTNLSSVSGSNYVLGGFEIYTTGVVSNTGATFSGTEITGFYSVMLENIATVGLRVRSQWGVLDLATLTSSVTNYSNNNVSTGALGVNSLQLQLSYNGNTHILTTGYSTDSGNSFITGTSFSLAGAQIPDVAPLNGGLGLRLFAASANTAGTIGAGTLYFDNLNVTSIPEPSTCAAICGACACLAVAWRRRALGLAAMHRRRRVKTPAE